jgi:hypothetical protein
MKKYSNRFIPSWLKNLRLAARLSSVLVIAGTIIYVVREISALHPLEAGTIHPPLDDYITYSSTAIYILGLLIAFKKELLGSLVSILWLLTSIVYTMHYSIVNPYLWILFIPPILYILSWYFHQKLSSDIIL